MKRASTFSAMWSLVIAVVALASSCKQEVSGQSATANAPSKQAAASSKKVAKIVFIGKRNACDCTRTRVDGSLAEVQRALRDHSGIAIEQLQVDVNAEAVARYQELRPIMVLPAIYLLEGSGNLIDVLQGEVTAAQLKKVIAK